MIASTLGALAGVFILAIFLAGATAPLWNREEDR